MDKSKRGKERKRIGKSDNDRAAAPSGVTGHEKEKSI